MHITEHFIYVPSSPRLYYETQALSSLVSGLSFKLQKWTGHGRFLGYDASVCTTSNRKESAAAEGNGQRSVIAG